MNINTSSNIIKKVGVTGYGRDSGRDLTSTRSWAWPRCDLTECGCYTERWCLLRSEAEA